MTVRGHSRHPDGESAGARKPASVAAKAAAIDAAQAHPLTWKTVVKRAAAVAVAGAALYLVLPKLIAVFGAWPRLSTLNPAWFTACLAAELVSFTCNFALQRLALRTRAWFPVTTAGLAGNAVTNNLPGGDAAGAAVQFRMLTTAGFDTDTAVGGLTAFSLLEVGGLLALPLFALPAIVAGVPVSRGLVHTALLGIAAFVLYAIFGPGLASRNSADLPGRRALFARVAMTLSSGDAQVLRRETPLRRDCSHRSVADRRNSTGRTRSPQRCMSPGPSGTPVSFGTYEGKSRWHLRPQVRRWTGTGGRDTSAHPPDSQSCHGHARLRPGSGVCVRRGPVVVPVAGRAGTVVSSARWPGWSDEGRCWRQGYRACLLVRPRARGIPGAGPRRWPARPP